MIHYVSNHMSDRLKKEKTSVPAVQPWQKLANAIVEQAVEDYRKAQARIKANPMIADHDSHGQSAPFGSIIAGLQTMRKILSVILR